jgi:hypothetical protein
VSAAWGSQPRRVTRRRRTVFIALLALLWLLGMWATRDVDSDTGTRTSGMTAPVREDRTVVPEQTWHGPRHGRFLPVRASRHRRPPGAGTPLNWAALRQCESGGNYRTDTGNGYYGAYQFDLRTWRSVGGTGNPAKATPAEQDHRAHLLYADRGAQPWPRCGRRLG